MIQIAPAAAQFPMAVKMLLQDSLRLRDRHQQGEISPHGLAVATGRLEAQLDRLLNRRFCCPDNQRLAKHLRHDSRTCSLSYTVLACLPPTTLLSGPSG
jgi:hypothetical protein